MVIGLIVNSMGFLRYPSGTIHISSRIDGAGQSISFNPPEISLLDQGILLPLTENT